MNKYLRNCRSARHLIINDIPVYKYNNHLTFQFTKSLEKIFLLNFYLHYYNSNSNDICNTEYRCFAEDIIKIKNEASVQKFNLF